MTHIDDRITECSFGHHRLMSLVAVTLCSLLLFLLL